MPIGMWVCSMVIFWLGIIGVDKGERDWKRLNEVCLWLLYFLICRISSPILYSLVNQVSYNIVESVEIPCEVTASKANFGLLRR
jgi:hypothetical protein